MILGIYFSFEHPMVMIYAIILFDVYWVLKVLNFSFYLIVAWRRLSVVKRIDWLDKLRHEVTGWEERHHLILIPLYNEEWTVVETTLLSLQKACYAKENFIVVLAGEMRQQENFETIYKKARKKFHSQFHDLVGVLHPSNLEDEIAGKGSNIHYAGSKMKDYIDKKGYTYEDVIVTVFDTDTVCHPHYFSYLTYLYCTHPNPTRSSFQPIAMFNNNMWESPAMLRIMAFGTTFWILTSLARQDALVTFSSHSMSFRALVDVGFHDKKIVSEDSRIFYQCYLHYNGDYHVTPMYLPVSMDTVRDDSWITSIKNLYKQQRRWAWGVEHVPYLLYEFRKKKKAIAWWKKVKWIFIEWEGKWSWCLAAIIITFLSRLPMWVASDQVKQSALFFNTPHMLEKLMTIAMIGLLMSAVFSLPLLPKKPQSHPKHMYLVMFLQWALLPITMLVVSALPALDAVTRLMLGKYLGFNVSIKKRAKTKV
ncbi:glycosyltransferase family 2 protein [Candidatus Nomurabacteria bacterium]|nr:glycosyltransferase family 2 protein [Candidatus Nomurabacteria bacterium]